MGCVSSSEKNVANMVCEKGYLPQQPGPNNPEKEGVGAATESDEAAKLESAAAQRRRLSVAPLLVGDVDGKRANPTEGKPRRLSLGAAPPSIQEGGDSTHAEPSVVHTQSWVALSKKGYVPYNRKKMNQDTYFIAESFLEGISLYGVCDGHGEFGHHVSAFVKNNMVRCLIAEERLRDDPLECIPRAITRLCADLADTQINVSFSGTTAVFAIKIDNQIIVGNIGDSRCIILQRSEKELVPIPLSRDQKPDEPDEKRRILAAGGRVEPLPGPVNEDMGPSRVWLAEIDVPGLAMSRSIGDDISHTVGVSSEPELRVHQITDADLFLVLASDGVWEFLSNQQVASLVANSVHDIELAATSVVQESTKKWQEVEEVIDDITFVILQLQQGPIVL